MNVTITIPATTANLGPGFDCLGLALALHNKVSFYGMGQGWEVAIQGEGAGQLPTDETNLVVQAAERVFARVGRRPAGMRIEQENQIPVGSGLGSSAAAVLGGLWGANALIKGGLLKTELLAMAVEMEGHADNVAAALFGGLVLVNAEGRHLHIGQLPVAEMKVVLVLPEVTISTAAARTALPETVPLADAVFNAGRVAALLPALAEADYATLAWATQDRLHEPVRLPLIPGAGAAKEAGRVAGAAAVVLSGAGPGLLAFAAEKHEAIARAMQAALATENIASRYWILPIDRVGTTLW